MKKNIQTTPIALCAIGVVAYWLVTIILLAIATVFTQNEYLSEGNWQIISLITQLIASLIGVALAIRMGVDNGFLVAACTGLGCVITSIAISIVFFDGLSNASIWNVVAVALGVFAAFVVSNKRKNKVKSRKKRIRNR